MTSPLKQEGSQLKSKMLHLPQLLQDSISVQHNDEEWMTKI